MSVVVEKMTKEQVEAMLENHRPGRIMPPEIKQRLEEQGWEFHDDLFCIRKIYKGYHLVIEFCIGDFCTYIGSKTNGYLLEKKVPKNTFVEALVQQMLNEQRIDDGEHWVGEDN